MEERWTPSCYLAILHVLSVRVVFFFTNLNCSKGECQNHDTSTKDISLLNNKQTNIIINTVAHTRARIHTHHRTSTIIKAGDITATTTTITTTTTTNFTTTTTTTTITTTNNNCNDARVCVFH